MEDHTQAYSVSLTISTLHGTSTSPVLRLTKEELDCLPREFISIDISSRRANPELEQVQAIRDCLLSDTLKSLTFLLDARPVSPEEPSAATIDCFVGMPMRSESLHMLMAAGARDDAALAEAALGFLMAEMLPVANCLPADQLATMGMAPEEQARMKCILKVTDGGRDLASAMRTGNAAAGLGIYDQARKTCSNGQGGLQTAAAPPHTPTPPVPPPVLHISQEEFDCLRPFDIGSRLFGWDTVPFRPTQVWEIRNCLSKESLKSLVSQLGDEPEEELSELTVACVNTSPLQGFYPGILRDNIEEPGFTEATLALLMSVMLMLTECSTDAELADMGITPDLQARMRCILDETGGGRELASAIG